MAYQLVRDFVYSYGQTYQGTATETTFEFATPAGPIAGPIADGIISNLEQQCAENNLTTLRTKIYVDYSPALETKYLVTFSLYSPSTTGIAGEGQRISQPAGLISLLPEIISAVLLIVVVVFIYLTVRTIKDIAYSPAGPETGHWI